MSEEEIFGHLERAILKEKFTINVNNLELSGWSFSSLGKQIVIDIFIDDEKIGEIKPDLNRPDVYEEYPSYKASLTSGFDKKLNAEKIDKGDHILKVISRSKDKEKQIKIAHFVLGKSE